MSVETWISQATADQLRAKIAEYEKLGDLGSQRENEMRSKLNGRLRIELAKREAGNNG